MNDTVVLCERWWKLLTNFKTKRKKKKEERNEGNRVFICIVLDMITYLCKQT